MPSLAIVLPLPISWTLTRAEGKTSGGFSVKQSNHFCQGVLPICDPNCCRKQSGRHEAEVYAYPVNNVVSIVSVDREHDALPLNVSDECCSNAHIACPIRPSR
jgi:hypothetical protein